MEPNSLGQHDSGIWEPEDPSVAFEEEDLDCLPPEDHEYGIYEDKEARVFHNDDVQYEIQRDPDFVVPHNDPYEKVYKDIPSAHHVLRKVPKCEYCGAIRFPGEGLGFCCRQGKVNIYNPDVPDRLRHLFTSQIDKDALYFRKNICYFNSHFLS
ncbi:hypothetical protein PVAP13_3KG387654 [Panicum virgatum]|uniref:Uncharacterized protein n=1 Tax=Panicum virgatum TaxID=38727 RepID=A0A8T0V2V3_PANVG|nr:hypothetical protein PVAP13_3KG387654 [Panicum virgatum]